MKILWLQKRPLYPATTGGRIRTLNVLRHLCAWHEITYLCNVQQGEEGAIDEMRRLGLKLETIPWREVPRDTPAFYAALARNLMSRYPYNVAKDFDRELRQRARALVADGSFDLVVCDFVQMARNAIGLDVPARLLFQHNVEAQIFRRHAENDQGRLRRGYMALQAMKMRRFEGYAGRQFDVVVAVSSRDRAMFERDYGWRHVETIDTAVDLDYFRPGAAAERPGRVVFIGSMDWLANEDGVQHFVRDIWPLVRAQHAAATFQIVGRNPSRAVRELAGDGVEVVGTVPDVRPYLADAAVAVVPLRIGGGTRIKIFEAMAMRKAVVSTRIGAEGLAVHSGDDVLLADEPGEFAAAVVRLLDDAEYRRQLSTAARDLVCHRFGAETVARQFEAACRLAVKKAFPERIERHAVVSA